MQASRLTLIATCESSRVGTRSIAIAGKRLSDTPCSSAMAWKCEERSCAVSRSGWSAISISMTTRREVTARAESVRTTMPSATVRMQEAARVRSPSISTMQARQLPSLR